MRASSVRLNCSDTRNKDVAMLQKTVEENKNDVHFVAGSVQAIHTGSEAASKFFVHHVCADGLRQAVETKWTGTAGTNTRGYLGAHQTRTKSLYVHMYGAGY